MPGRFADPLHRLKIAAPCSEEWDSMSGNEQVRFCSHCDLSVHNLTTMTSLEALALVSKSEGRLCVRYYRRPDGMIQTATENLYNIKRRASRLAAGAFTATLSLCSGVHAQSPATVEPSAVVHIETGGERQQDARPDKQSDLGGMLTGAITDMNGAVIPGAKITLVDEKTGAQQAAATDEEGIFRFQSLPLGVYTLKAESEYFAMKQTTGVFLAAGGERRVDMSLEVTGTFMGIMVVSSEPDDLFVKAAYKDDLAVVKELLAGGANVNIKDKEVDTTALMQSVGNGNHEMVKVLLNAGARVDLKSNDGRTALMNLSEKTSPEIIWSLISAGAKVNRKDERGDTPLIIAAAVENAPAVQALLDAGAKVNAKNKEGRTPLMAAAYEDRLENVRALLLAGADVHRKNENGETALSMARDYEYLKIVKLLEAYGAH